MVETKCKRGFQSHVMCDCEPVHPLTALASGSGDHAELVASLRKPEIWQSYPGPEGDFEIRLAPFDAATAIEAIIAEVAALRAANTEAERKLVEAEAYKAAWEYVFGCSDAESVREMVAEQNTPPWPLPHHLNAMSLRPKGYDSFSKEAERGLPLPPAPGAEDE